MTGVRRAPPPNRVLATVLFTDIVGSTRAGTGARRQSLVRPARSPPRRCGASSSVSADARWTRRETASSPASTGRPAPSGALIAIRGGRAGPRHRDPGRHPHRRVRGAGDNLTGIAVHTGARVWALAGAGECSSRDGRTTSSAGSGIGFEERGTHSLKGIPGEHEIFAVRSTDPCVPACEPAWGDVAEVAP